MKRTYISVLSMIAAACIISLSGCNSDPVQVNNYYITNSDGSVQQIQSSEESDSEPPQIDNTTVTASVSPINTTSTDEGLSVGIKYSVTGTKNYLALRNAPSYDSSNEIAKLQNGDEVFIKSQTVYGDKYEYCYVTVISGNASGKEGYVNKDYLKKGASNLSDKNSNTKPSTNGTYTVYTVTGTTNYLGVRTAPVYDESNIICKLNNGDQVYVYSTDTYGDKGEYWYISVPNVGKEGYVNKSYLKKNESSSTSSKSSTSSGNNTTQQTSDRDKLHNAFISKVNGANEIYFFYDDFDGNGTKEAYGITGNGNSSQYNDVCVYYVSSSGVVTQCDSNMAGFLLTRNNGIVTAENSKFIVWIESYGGSGSTVHIYGVRNGSSYEPQISTQYNDFYSDDNGNYIAHSNDFSTGAHTYPEHYFSYDSSSGEFYEITSANNNGTSAPGNNDNNQGSHGTIYTVTGTNNYLAIRSAPAYDESNVIAKLNNGATVQVNSTDTYGDKGEYWYVTDPNSGISGYANKKYLK